MAKEKTLLVLLIMMLVWSKDICEYVDKNGGRTTVVIEKRIKRFLLHYFKKLLEQSTGGQIENLCHFVARPDARTQAGLNSCVSSREEHLVVATVFSFVIGHDNRGKESLRLVVLCQSRPLSRIIKLSFSVFFCFFFLCQIDPGPF